MNYPNAVNKTEAEREALADKLSAGLELVPIEPDTWREKLVRAGLAESDKSGRSLLRAEVEK